MIGKNKEVVNVIQEFVSTKKLENDIINKIIRDDVFAILEKQHVNNLRDRDGAVEHHISQYGTSYEYGRESQTDSEIYRQRAVYADVWRRCG